MRIGLDIRPLQGHHSVRGIGMHIQALLRWIMSEYKGDDTFVFYVYEKNHNPVEDYPTSKVIYEIVELSDYRSTLPFVPTLVSASVAYIRRVLTPIPSRLARKSDVFLGFDFMLGMPRGTDVKYALIGYDLIPLMYQKQYLPNFFEARSTLGIRQALFSHVVSVLYRRAARLLNKKNARILSISDNSKQQFIQYADIPEDRIRTVYLGNPIAKAHFTVNEDDLARVTQYKKDSFLLFIGGTDWRRRLPDLISAFNQLKARGHNLKLILAGYDFRDIDTITDPESKQAIMDSSYRSDIQLMGFINDSEKKYLYENAVAFVFPSICEGFGLPILEALQESCPVIAYNGPLSSMEEVAQDGAIIIKPSASLIYQSVLDILAMDEETRKKLERNGHKIVERYSWSDCSEQTIAALKDPSFM